MKTTDMPILSQKIVAFLQLSPDCTWDEISGGTGIPKADMPTLCGELTENGTLTVRGELNLGRYRLAS